MRVLALEPYYGGSHRAMLDGWQRHSRHQIEILGLPARHWKWRMRHAGLTLAQRADQWLTQQDACPDALFVSSMLDLPQWRGSVNADLARLPVVAYFHENQLTHPLGEHQQTDLHYGFTNILTAIDADASWFNSCFHQRSFFAAARSLLGRMPDYRHQHDLEKAESRTTVLYPGIAEVSAPTAADSLHDGVDLRSSTDSQPVHLGWIARWEADKQPALFLQALSELKKRDRPFRLTVLSRPTKTSQPLWDDLINNFAAEMEFAGYARSDDEYRRRVASLDGVISTAAHEFFGIAIAEAASLGVIPIVPGDLAYPELYEGPPPAALFHENTVPSIVTAVEQLARLRENPTAWRQQGQRGRGAVNKLFWPRQTERFDQLLEGLVAERGEEGNG